MSRVNILKICQYHHYRLFIVLVFFLGACKKNHDPIDDPVNFDWIGEKPASFVYNNKYYNSTSVNASIGGIDSSAYYGCAMNFNEISGFHSVLYVHIPTTAKKNDLINLDYPMGLFYNIGYLNVIDYGKSDLTGKCKILNITTDTIEIAFYGAIILNSNQQRIIINDGYFISKID